MAEYIKREAVAPAIDEQLELSEGEWLFVHRAIANIPSTDAVPVVHGRWLKHYRSGVTVREGWVSSCCDMWNDRNSNYCPNCGAKMNGDGA